ncbi:bifunctional diguanylate cyclase/phosphodiesterase [Actinoplanes sp. NPDC023714]|uniref:putative bifunctional diguanylate cyclase/phosphodiesterase n=1 Tax=Actinoplanes sp. NPDC023714 TaxID=3154322 RepID=UPI0034043B7A
MRRANLWGWWVAAGAAATAGYHLLPAGGEGRDLAYNVIGLVSVLAILAGVRLHRPERPAMWYWFAAGQAASVAGDLVWNYYVYVLHEEPYPSVADVFYLAAYPLLVAGLWLLVRGRGGGLTEAGIVGVGLGLVFWVFVLHPIAADTAVTGLEQAVSTAYPAADALLLGFLARLFLARAGTASTRLLAVAAVLLLIADVGYSVVSLYSGSDDDQFAAGWLLSYVVWAAAALHPSMRVPPEPESAASRGGRVQAAVLGASALLGPVLLFVPGVGGNAVDRAAIGAGSVILFLLVLARVYGLARRVRGQAAELERIAMHDDLTGLPNRRQFEQALVAAAAHGPPWVAFVGLNGLKNINEELGRPVGDRVLTVLAGRIALAGGVAARIGGDEFAVLLSSSADAGPAAERLAATLAEPVAAGGHELLVGAGVGLAEAADPVEVLRRAEAAMHAAKETGEPYRTWTAELDERAGEHARVGAELRAALDAGQFQVVYQPIVAVPEGRIAAVEALVRWHHPQRGLVSPAQFIPVAEHTGLIVELGAWILRTACERMARWRAELGAGAPDRVSVNVSARQLARPGFSRTVADALALAGLPPECLTVEVTETAVFGGGQAVTTLHELRAAGVRIALDDFGTGHSSLGLLHTVPVDVLKVDKSFVDDVTEAGRHTVIARALIQVADGLGLTAVAEGVETAEQAEALYALGYRLLQGYYFGKPAAELPATISRRPRPEKATDLPVRA